MQNCSNCTKKMWTTTDKFVSGRRVCQCRNCGKLQLELPPQGLEIPPKVLYFDIETAPLTIRAFRTGRQYVSWRNIEQEGFVLCWAAIWVGKNKVLSDCVLPKEAKKQNDKRCLSGLWELMDQADYVVGHNMRAFDCKYVEGRFIKFGWDAPYNTKIVDTLTISRRKFRLSSHSLDALLKMFEEDGKNEMNEQDWRNCLHGDEKALKKMVTYCRGDVRKGVSILKRFQKYIESGGGKPLFT